MTQLLNTFSVLFLALVLVACSSKTTIESDMGLSDAPDWVNEGTQAVKDDETHITFDSGFTGTCDQHQRQKNHYRK